MGIDSKRITSMMASGIADMNEEDLKELEGSVLVDYDDSIASHIAMVLKRKSSVRTYVLDGGIRRIAMKLSNDWM